MQLSKKLAVVNKFSYRFTDLANLELIEAVVWYESNKINLGKEFKIKLTEVLKLVCSNPYYFQIKHSSFREVKIKKFPFLVIYEVNEKLHEILILSVFNTSRNPKLKFKKK